MFTRYFLFSWTTSPLKGDKLWYKFQPDETDDFFLVFGMRPFEKVNVMKIIMGETVRVFHFWKRYQSIETGYFSLLARVSLKSVDVMKIIMRGIERFFFLNQR